MPYGRIEVRSAQHAVFKVFSPTYAADATDQEIVSCSDSYCSGTRVRENWDITSRRSIEHAGDERVRPFVTVASRHAWCPRGCSREPLGPAGRRRNLRRVRGGWRQPLNEAEPLELDSVCLEQIEQRLPSA